MSMKKGVSRRTVMKAGAAGLAVTSAIGIAPKFINPANAAGLGAGMTGGPTGFDGAERFQYNESNSEGRAIEGIKALKAAGKAPKKLTMLLTDGAIGQINKPFPVGKVGNLGPFPEGAPSVKEVWERETGIEIEIIGAEAQAIVQKVLQDITTGSGAYDIYTGPWNSTGDFAEAKGIANLNDYVAKYKPDWDDPERGTPSKEMEQLLGTYAGNYYSFSLDGDFQTWFYRKDLYENPEVQKMFGDKTGVELNKPDTWEDIDRISEFFTGFDGGNGAMSGNGNLMSPFWGLASFYGRYASMGYDQGGPENNFYFDEEGNPAIDSDFGIQCAEEHVNSMKWALPDALSNTWAEAYGSMWELKIPQVAIYTNIVKFGDGFNADGTPKSKATGKIGAHLPPGRKNGNKINRRSVLYYHITGWISTKSKNQEAAYLFMQWLSSTRTYTWMCGNPGGYFDPMQLSNFNEPLVEATYHPYSMDIIPKTIARSAPSINFAGQGALDNALDEEIQQAIVGQQTASEAMKKVSKRWQKIIRKRKSKGILDAISAQRTQYPVGTDEAS
jgi:multiple sugar transport system substrate-binding protein